MTPGIRRFIFSWWGWVLMVAIVLFWIACMGLILVGSSHQTIYEGRRPALDASVPGNVSD